MTNVKNRRRKMINRAKKLMLIKADTLEESGWWRYRMRGCGADDKLLQMMIREAIEMSEGTKEQMNRWADEQRRFVWKYSWCRLRTIRLWSAVGR